MKADHLLVAMLDEMTRRLGGLGKEAGSRNDYRGVRRDLYGAGGEEDESRPWIQVGLGQRSVVRESTSTIRLNQEVIVQVHVAASGFKQGFPDALTPALNAQADIFEALMADRSLASTSGMLFYDGPDAPPAVTVAAGDNETFAVGATVRERYRIQYDHSGRDMSVAA